MDLINTFIKKLIRFPRIKSKSLVTYNEKNVINTFINDTIVEELIMIVLSMNILDICCNNPFNFFDQFLICFDLLGVSFSLVFEGFESI